MWPTPPCYVALGRQLSSLATKRDHILYYIWYDHSTSTLWRARYSRGIFGGVKYMAKQDVMKAIEHEWNAFANLAESFPEENRFRPGAVGYWNVHEALLHVAAWDNEVMILVKKFEETGEKPEWLDWSGDAIDELNERQVSERRDLEPASIWEHFKGTHKTLVEFLSTCDDHIFSVDSFTGDSIKAETWQHYQGHGQDLTRFKESL
jgi:hypothetical protein